MMPRCFPRTVDWAVEQGIETSTYHILTPYPDTGLHDRMKKEDRLLHNDWDLYDTRHTVFKPALLSPDELEEGYWDAYRSFYTWKNIFAGASSKPNLLRKGRHMAYSAGWKKFEGLWNYAILLEAGQSDAAGAGECVVRARSGMPGGGSCCRRAGSERAFRRGGWCGG